MYTRAVNIELLRPPSFCLFRPPPEARSHCHRQYLNHRRWNLSCHTRHCPHPLNYRPRYLVTRCDVTLFQLHRLVAEPREQWGLDWWNWRCVSWRRSEACSSQDWRKLNYSHRLSRMTTRTKRRHTHAAWQRQWCSQSKTTKNISIKQNVMLWNKVCEMKKILYFFSN